MKKYIALFILNLSLVVTFSRCSTTTKQTDVKLKEARKDQGIISNDSYIDNSYWKSSDLNLITNLSVKVQNQSDDFSDCSYTSLSKEQSKKIKYLKKLIYEYFLDTYNIDFSDKLDKQSVTLFNSSDIENSLTMGYVGPADENTLHLHISLKNKNAELFESTYVRETLHQLCFIDKSEETTYIVEGIVDAYSDLILAKAGEDYIATAIYFETRQLGYQLIAADKELPEVFYKHESFKEHLNKDLSSYNQPYIKHNDIADYLNTLLYTLISVNSGFAELNYTPYYYYVFDAQSIVQKFCQAQEPNSSTIEYLRKHCLLTKFEILKIEIDGKGYRII